MVPHLITALTGPINELEARILESMPVIERWFRLEWMEHTPTFYTSVDLRNAGYKLAPVDSGLFPGSFNNLSPEMLPQAVQAAMAAIEKICPEARNLLLIPDTQGAARHASAYLTSLHRLIQIFNQAGLNVRLGSLNPALTSPETLKLPDGTELKLEPLVRTRHRLGLKDFDPCTILLNDDLSAGVPEVLQNLHEQYLLPPVHAGWDMRRKSQYYACYEEVAKRFAKLLGMDPWLIHPTTAAVPQVDLATPEGLLALQTQADAVLGKVRRKCKEYGINEKPFVVIRADQGHGVPPLTVRDPKQLSEAPQALQAALARLSPQGGPVDLIVQEGVPTYERMNDAVAEPVVYLMDRYVVGGFYRVHPDRGTDEHLNLPGARFVPLAFAESQTLPRPGERPGASAPNRFYMYGVIARLAMLAASYELEATDPDAEVYD